MHTFKITICLKQSGEYEWVYLNSLLTDHNSIWKLIKSDNFSCIDQIAAWHGIPTHDSSII